MVNGFPNNFSGSTPGNNGIWSKPDGNVLVMDPVTLLKAAKKENVNLFVTKAFLEGIIFLYLNDHHIGIYAVFRI